MSIIVKINSLDKSNLIDFNSLEVKNLLYSNPDVCYFTYQKYGSRTYVPVGGDEIGVWDGVTKIFGGKIINVNRKIDGKVLVYDVECKDWTDQLDGELVTETYESKTVNEIIIDLQSKYATAFDITNVSCATNIEAIYFAMKPMSKCLDELAEIAGYHWFVNADEEIYFFSEGSITSPFDITDDNGYCLSQSLSIAEDYEQIKNRVNIQGGTVTNIQVSDATSIATYGEHEIVIKDETLTSDAEATQKASAVLAAYKDPIHNGSFQTYEAGLIAGQKINVNSTLRDINQDFIIETVAFKARTPTDFIYTIDIMTQYDKDIIGLFETEIMKPLSATEESFGNRDFNCDVKFSITDYNTISWAAGSIIMSSGETYSIASGNHSFTNTEICFFNPTTSATVLQFSTTFGDGVGEDRIGLGYAIPNPNTAMGAQFIPVGFMGGVRFWGGENIVARTIIADQIGLQALTSELVTAGEFITSSAQIKDAIITDAKISGVLTVGHTEAQCTDAAANNTQTALDAGASLDNAKANGITFIQGGYIKTGIISATNIVTGTLTAVKVQTSSSGMRVVLDNSDNTLKFYDSGGSVAGYMQGGSNHITISGITYLSVIGQVQASTLYLSGGSGGITVLWNNSLDIGTSSYRFRNLYIGTNIYVNGTVDGVDISAHAASASAHHTKYTDSEARGAITGYTIYPGSVIPNSVITYDLGSSSYKWRNLYIGGDITVPENTPDIHGDLIPTTDNYYELGNSSYKWYRITAHYTTFGDVSFINNFRIAEEEEGKEGLSFYNQNDKKIMVLDEDGNLWTAGGINPKTEMAKEFPFYKIIEPKAKLKIK